MIYAVYQVAIFGAPAAGQMALQSLGPGGFPPFAFAAAPLAVAIVPMAMTSADPPVQPRTIRPRLGT